MAEIRRALATWWTDISTLDGPPCMRRALEKSKRVIIDLECMILGRDEVKLEPFPLESDPHPAQWRSLNAAVVRMPSAQLERALAPLTTTQTPSLESLRLSVLDVTHSIYLKRQLSSAELLLDLAVDLVSLDSAVVEAISSPQLFEIRRSSPCLESRIWTSIRD